MKKIMYIALITIIVIMGACSKKSDIKRGRLTFCKSFFNNKNSLATAD